MRKISIAVWIALGITIAYIVGLWLLGAVSVEKWEALLSRDLNNLGDFLAGVFAPLAFLWLATAVVLQSQELREQRMEIAANRKVAEDQSGHLSQQAKILAEQLEASREAAADARLDGEIDQLVSWARAIGHNPFDVRYGDIRHRFAIDDGMSDNLQLAFKRLIANFHQMEVQLVVARDREGKTPQSIVPGNLFRELNSRLFQLAELVPQVSEHRRNILKAMKIEELSDILRGFVGYAPD